MLAGLSATSDWDQVTQDRQLRDWLAENPVPAPRLNASGPLFHGTLIFFQFIFQETGQPSATVSIADTEIARDYASTALITIQRYTSRYGTSSVSVSQDVIPFTANVSGDSFTLSQFEGWIDECAGIAEVEKVINPCIVLLHNRSLQGSPQFSNERLSVADNNHTINGIQHEKVYAHILSHEITEMLVDPKGDLSNPEVCDPCAGNCNNIWFDLFDQNGVFLGGTPETATATGFAFFINAIVSPGAALDGNGCLVQASQLQTACVYAPPFVSGELLSYGDTGTTGNVSAPALVGFGGWLDFRFLFAGRNIPGQNRIYAVPA